MFVNILFGFGSALTVFNVYLTFSRGVCKPESIVLPFTFLAAAATGHYIGL